MSDFNPPDVGALLRGARERDGVTLRRLALTTKIPFTVLEALERNDVSHVPGGIFGRSFVRTYAREVGLDPEKTVEAFFDALPATQSATFRRTRDGIDTAVSDGRRRLIALGVGLMLLSVALGVGWVVLTLRNGSPLSGNAPSGRGAEVAVGLPNRGDTDPIARPLIVEIHPTADCHVSLTVDGMRVLSRLVRAGEREVHEVHQRMVIEAGDAAAFAFSINRQRGQPLGAPGDDVTLVIDRDNYRRFLVH